MTTKYVVEQEGFYLVINEDLTEKLTNKIREATLFNDEREALLAAEHYIDDSHEGYKVIGLT
jgi:hypothetical protein